MRMLVRNLAAAEAGVQEGEEEHQTPPQRQLGPLGAGRASVRLFPSRQRTRQQRAAATAVSPE